MRKKKIKYKISSLLVRSMRYIVTHTSPDLDAVTSVWLLKRFLKGWEDAEVRFVSAGEKLPGSYEQEGAEIEMVDGNQVIHVDTGMGKLDHHHTNDQTICAATLTYDFVREEENLSKRETKQEAVRRMVEVIVANDHFQEVFYSDVLSDYHVFSLEGILDGLKLQRRTDEENTEFAMSCLDAILHTVENRIWAEKEIEEKGQTFETRWGKGVGIETVNNNVLKLSQMMGFVIAVQKDPNNGFIRIKARPRRRRKFDPPNRRTKFEIQELQPNMKDIHIDLTPVYEKLRKMDPHATWFLHISKRMLLNGSAKNPKMKGSKLSLSDIVHVLSKPY